MPQFRSVTPEEREEWRVQQRRTKENLQRLFEGFKQLTPEEIEAQLREQREKYKDVPVAKQPGAPTSAGRPDYDRRPYMRGVLQQPNQDGSIRRPLRQPGQNGSDHTLYPPLGWGSRSATRPLRQKDKRFGAFYGRLKGVKR